jgi:hypothetical protein
VEAADESVTGSVILFKLVLRRRKYHGASIVDERRFS